MWTKECIEAVVRKYLLGSSLVEISIILCLSLNDIEEIIDIFLLSEGILI